MFVCVLSVVLAVKVEAVEGRNESNVYALNRSRKQCFVMLYYVLFVYSYLCCVELSYCDIEGKFSFYAFIRNNKFLWYFVFVKTKTNERQLTACFLKQDPST